MKKNIYLLISIISLSLAFYGCSNDYDDVRNGNISVKGVEADSDKKFIRMEDNKTLQLEVFVMPQDLTSKVKYSLTGTTTGAIEITPDGLITPLVKTPAEGEIPSPLGIDTIIVSLEKDPNIYVKYPVRVYSHIVLVSSINLGSSGQYSEIEVGKTFDLSKFVTINPSNASDKTVSYYSEDESIATVDQNGVITAVGEIGESTSIFITSNDRGKQTAESKMTIIAEAPMYVEMPMNAGMLSSNLETKEGSLEALLDDKNSTFWAPDILKRPNYSPACYLDIDFGEVIKYSQLYYRHRSLNYGHLQCYIFTLQGKKSASDAWIDLGTYETQELQVEKYQVFGLGEPEDEKFQEIQYLRINFVKGHLRAGKPDWNYEEDGNVSVGDIKVYVYNR
ncbi:Ig-like domain-containing protein [Bacteroides sp. 51]|uniref:Ig-like domain-containing protein n=1 Tax=Bacteroides sp. 51 TaxID=2302938 RepID=UPI0013D5ED8C|nr:Ig-like domain-containing protein [Bacteroides sp. 51]NDV83461.1 Ig-like domain-containing protein [Bacteroides sp. 51]